MILYVVQFILGYHILKLATGKLVAHRSSVKADTPGLTQFKLLRPKTTYTRDNILLLGAIHNTFNQSQANYIYLKNVKFYLLKAKSNGPFNEFSKVNNKFNWIYEDLAKKTIQQNFEIISSGFLYEIKAFLLTNQINNKPTSVLKQFEGKLMEFDRVMSSSNTHYVIDDNSPEVKTSATYVNAWKKYYDPISHTLHGDRIKMYLEEIQNSIGIIYDPLNDPLKNSLREQLRRKPQHEDVKEYKINSEEEQRGMENLIRKGETGTINQTSGNISLGLSEGINVYDLKPMTLNSDMDRDKLIRDGYRESTRMRYFEDYERPMTRYSKFGEKNEFEIKDKTESSGRRKNIYNAGPRNQQIRGLGKTFNGDEVMNGRSNGVNFYEPEMERGDKNDIIHKEYIQNKDPLILSDVKARADTGLMQGSFGKMPTPFQQLTSFATGDIMTGYKPLTELHRPFVPQEQTRRSEGGMLLHRTTGGAHFHKKGTILNKDLKFEDLTSKVDNNLSEIPGRIPKPTQAGRVVPESKVYGQNEIDLKLNDKLRELEIWNVSNPYYSVTGDLNDRSMDISTQKFDRMNISDLLPVGGDRSDARFHTSLDPKTDVSNKNKTFYATNKIGQDYNVEYTSLRDDADENRERNFIQVPFRSGQQIHKQGLVRTENFTKQTSNKTNSDHNGLNYEVSNREAYYQPIRTDIDIYNQNFVVEPWSQIALPLPSGEVSREGEFNFGTTSMNQNTR